MPEHLEALHLNDILTERVVTVTRGGEYFDGLLDAVNGADVVLLRRQGDDVPPTVLLPWVTWRRMLLAVAASEAR